MWYDARMAVELKDVEHLAGLARIAVSDAEKKSLAHDLGEILSYVSQIKEVENGKSKVESGLPAAASSATIGAVGRWQAGELRNVMREDRDPHAPKIHTEDLLDSAPARKGDYVVVKKIL